MLRIVYTVADYTSGTTITVNPPGPRGCIDFTDLVVDDNLPYEGVESFVISIEGMAAMAIVIILDDDGKLIIYDCMYFSLIASCNIIFRIVSWI